MNFHTFFWQNDVDLEGCCDTETYLGDIAHVDDFVIVGIRLVDS